MHFWLTLLHIAAMAVWFSGLFFLPRLLPAIGGEGEDTGEDPGAGASATARRPARLGRMLFFGVMTPGAVATIALGMLLLTYGFRGAWLPAKLALVGIAVLLHVYFGHRLFDPQQTRHSLRRLIDRVLAWLPLPLLLAIAALAAAKPGALPPLGGT